MIFKTFLSILTLLLFDKMEFTPNLFIVLFVFVSYALIGFLDDYISLKNNTNKATIGAVKVKPSTLSIIPP